MKSITINLLPSATRFQLSQIRLAKRLRRIAYLIVLLWLIIGVISFSLIGVLGYQKRKLIDQKNQLETSIKEFSPQIDLQQALRFRLKVTAEVLKGRFSMAEKMRRLEAIFPEGTSIRSLKIKKTGIEIAGQIPNLVSLADFERELVKAIGEYYSQAKIESLSRGKSNWSFVLKLKEIEEK